MIAAYIQGAVVGATLTVDSATLTALGNAWVDITAVSPQPVAGWTAVEADGTWTFAAPTPTLAQQAATALSAALAAGIAITSTSLPAVNATYALDAVSTAQIFQIGTYAHSFGVFPNGGTTLAYPDSAGVPMTFTLAVFVAFLQAVAPLVDAIQTQAGIMANGGTASWPSQTATIL